MSNVYDMKLPKPDPAIRLTYRYLRGDVMPYSIIFLDEILDFNLEEQCFTYLCLECDTKGSMALEGRVVLGPHLGREVEWVELPREVQSQVHSFIGTNYKDHSMQMIGNNIIDTDVGFTGVWLHDILAGIYKNNKKDVDNTI